MGQEPDPPVAPSTTGGLADRLEVPGREKLCIGHELQRAWPMFGVRATLGESDLTDNGSATHP